MPEPRTKESGKRFLVLPSPRSEHGISWGPFTLDEAKKFIRCRTDGLIIVLSKEERHPNPRVFNHAKSEAEVSPE